MMGMTAKTLRYSLLQLLFNGQRRLAFGQAQPLRHPENMSVDSDCGFSKGHTEHDVGGLAAHTCQALELLALAWHLATKIFDEGFRQGNDVFRLCPKESNGFDVLNQARLSQLQHLLRSGDFFEQGFGRLVDPLVGGLSREHHGYKQGVGVHVVEFAFRFRINRSEAFKYCLDFLAADHDP